MLEDSSMWGSRWVRELSPSEWWSWVWRGHKSGSRWVTELGPPYGWEQQASKYPFKLMSLINNKQSSQEWMLFISDAYFPILVLACHFSFLYDANGKPTMHLRKSPTDIPTLVTQGTYNWVTHTVTIHDHVQLVWWVGTKDVCSDEHQEA
jgi:hypothetical protein